MLVCVAITLWHLPICGCQFLYLLSNIFLRLWG